MYIFEIVSMETPFYLQTLNRGKRMFHCMRAT